MKVKYQLDWFKMEKSFHTDEPDVFTGNSEAV